MRIGFVTSVPITIEAFFLDWLRAWSDRGWAVHAASGGPRPNGLVATSYTDIAGLTQDPGRSSLRALRSLAAWRKANELDVVVVNTATASALYRMLPRHRAKTVYFCHGLHFGDRPDNLVDRAFWLAESALLRRTDGAIVMNSADVDFFANSLDKSNVHMLAAGVGLDPEQWTIRSDAPATVAEPERSGTKLVWMGMFSKRKRPHDAVRVLDALRHQHDPTATLTMLGSGPLHDDVRALIADLDLAAHVQLPGQVDPRPHLAEADVLVHTAEWEGYCRTLVEASFVGLPAVSYDVKGCRDVFGVEAVGRPGDVQGLVGAIAASPKRQLDLQGRPDFSWQAAFESTTSFLLETVSVR